MVKRIGLGVFIFAVLFIAFNLIKQISLNLQSGNRLPELISEVSKLQVKNQHLKSQLENIKTNQFIEQQARDKLGLVKPGETIVIISEDKIRQILGASASAVTVRLPNWQGWLKLFFK